MIEETLLKLLLNSCDTIFSTDLYKSILTKSHERSRRVHEEIRIINRQKTKKPDNWKEFLSNNKNKLTIVRLLEENWSTDASVSELLTRKVVIICEQKTSEFAEAITLTRHDGLKTSKEVISSLESTQEETDTRIVLYSLFAKDMGYKSVRVHSQDSDFILL